MNIIRAIEEFSYYYSITGRSLDEWRTWRQQAMKEWGLASEKCREEIDE